MSRWVLYIALVCALFSGHSFGESRRSSNSGEKTTDKDTEGGWLACDGTEAEACHCEQEEIDCDKVVFEGDSPLATANLDIKNKSFRVVRATFRENSIIALKKGKILPGHEGSMRELDFSKNRISHIESGTFSGFKSLNKLYLSFNRLNQLKKDQFSGLKDLHQLFLESNKITDLVDGVFEHLSNLKKLVLDGNKIKFRKGMFTGLDSLEELSLDNCGIENLDVNAFEALPQLKKLSLRGNPFTEIPRAVNSLDALEDLDISNTNIAEFHAQSLMDDRKLKQLYMSDMPFLYAIQDCAFCGLEKLELLHMNNCTRLHEIHPNAFGWSDLSAGRVSGIKHFYVEHCKLQTISEDLLPWDTLDELGIGGNPINCTCETSFLLEDEYYSYEYTNAIPKCAAPPELKGRPFTKVAQVDACPSKASAERSGRFAGVFMMLLILVFCTVGVYFCLVTKRWQAIVRHIQNPPLSYSNLASKEDQQGLEQDFQPRPQDV